MQKRNQSREVQENNKIRSKYNYSNPSSKMNTNIDFRTESIAPKKK